jgi:transposase
MAMGKRKDSGQSVLFVAASGLQRSPAHPFYDKLNEVLAAAGFDAFAEERCARFYHDTLGRPGLAPGTYFRCLFLGYFEGIDSERGIAWRLADSLSVRRFLGLALDENAPDHSTISRTRRHLDQETHLEIFTWVLKVLAGHGLIDGKTVGVDSTTLEANAAMRGIQRKDTRESYQEFLARLARESGIETPTREDLVKIDKKRKNKASNDDWESPSDPDAKIAKMKDGTTHLAHKAEHAVDMGENGCGAVLAVNLTPADQGDTETLVETVEQASDNLEAVAEDPRTEGAIAEDFAAEVVGDKGYHSNQTMEDLQEMGTRSYVPEPDRGRRDWEEQADAKAAVYANRRRTKGERGKRLMRRRGEFIERSFAHLYETGRMRRVYLRGRENIHKRLLIHAGGFNLSLIMRKLIGKGTPRGLQGFCFCLFPVFAGLWAVYRRCAAQVAKQLPIARTRELRYAAYVVLRDFCVKKAFTTGCYMPMPRGNR